jgi:hypothetical protein
VQRYFFLGIIRARITSIIGGNFGASFEFKFATFLATAANTVQIERVVRDVKIEQIANHRLDILDAGVAKLDNFRAIGANNVVVLLETVGFFVLRQVASELMFSHQIAIDQQLERVVNRCSTNPITLVFHVNIQRFGVKMVVAAVNFLQNCVPFGRFSERTFLQMRGKYRGDFFYYVCFFAVRRHFFELRIKN